MAEYGEWTPTGRKTTGPDSELIELEGPDGSIRTAIDYSDRYADSVYLTTDVELVQSFMEFPMVPGMADMAVAQLGQGVFIYDTGPIVPIVDVVRAYRDKRKAAGIRAGLELARDVARILQEASDNGPIQGIYSSGGLTPWRVAITADGEAQVLGYGLPQIQMIDLREGRDDKPREENFYYCPPERLTSGDEDISTDIYSLALLAYEVITGKPLYAGKPKELQRIVRMGEAQTLLMSDTSALPAAAHSLFVQALAFDPDNRFEQPEDFAQAVEALLDSPQAKGKSLAEVVKEVGGTMRRGKSLKSGSKLKGPSQAPAGVSTRTSRRGRTAEPAAPSGEAAPSASGRWGKASRKKEPEAESEAPARRTRRARGAGADEAEAAPRRARRARGADTEDAKPRRARRSADAAPEAEVAKPRRARRSADAAPEAEVAKPRRARRTSQAEPKAEATATAQTAPEAEAAAEAKPRRARRTSRAKAPQVDAAPEADVAPEAKATAEATAEAKPRRARRTSRAKAAPEAEATPEATAEANPRRARRTSRAKAAPEAEATPEATAEAKPRRARRTAKAAPEAEAEAKPRRARRSSGTDDDGPRPRRARRSKKE